MQYKMKDFQPFIFIAEIQLHLSKNDDDNVKYRKME